LLEWKHRNPFVQIVGVAARIDYDELPQFQVIKGNAHGLGDARGVAILNLDPITRAVKHHYRASAKSIRLSSARRSIILEF
jgi:hypothetical protein